MKFHCALEPLIDCQVFSLCLCHKCSIFCPTLWRNINHTKNEVYYLFSSRSTNQLARALAFFLFFLRENATICAPKPAEWSRKEDITLFDIAANKHFDSKACHKTLTFCALKLPTQCHIKSMASATSSYTYISMSKTFINYFINMTCQGSNFQFYPSFRNMPKHQAFNSLPAKLTKLG